MVVILMIVIFNSCYLLAVIFIVVIYNSCYVNTLYKPAICSKVQTIGKCFVINLDAEKQPKFVS